MAPWGKWQTAKWRSVYLPQKWFEDAARAQEVKLPPGTVYQSKTELALEVIDQALAWELPALPVGADSFYGNDFDFRQAMRERHLPYAVQVGPSTVVWTTDPNLPLPPPKKPKRGQPRRYPPLEALPRPESLEKLAPQLPASAWRTVTWRQGSRGAQSSRFALLPVWAAHRWWQQAHPPRVKEWLLVEWPKEEKQATKYWLAQLPSLSGKSMAETWLQAMRCPGYRWRDCNLGSDMELENLSGGDNGKGTSGSPRGRKYRYAWQGQTVP